jgi:hypothetical protein
MKYNMALAPREMNSPVGVGPSWVQTKITTRFCQAGVMNVNMQSHHSHHNKLCSLILGLVTLIPA